MTLYLIEHVGGAPAAGLANPIGSGDLSLVLTSGTGYPTGAGGKKFILCLDAGTATEEKILCDARSGTAVTINASGRGFDNTTASSHSAGSGNVTHVWTATEASDDNTHIYDTTRDDHTQYLRTDGTRAGTGPQTIGGALTVSSGGAAITGNSTITGTAHVTGAATLDSTLGVTGAATLSSTLGVTGAATLSSTLDVTGAATLSSTLGVTGAITGSSTVTGTALAATLAGNGRYVGITNGAPATGTYLTGDFANDPTNSVFWVCTAGGSPGTWAQVGGGATDTAWTNVTVFAHGWTASGTTPGFILRNGIVYLRGALTAGTANQSAFTLPSGYRPSQQGDYIVSISSEATNMVNVATTGAVTPLNAATTWLTQISFPIT